MKKKRKKTLNTKGKKASEKIDGNTILLHIVVQSEKNVKKILWTWPQNESNNKTNERKTAEKSRIYKQITYVISVRFNTKKKLWIFGVWIWEIVCPKSAQQNKL